MIRYNYVSNYYFDAFALESKKNPKNSRAITFSFAASNVASVARMSRDGTMRSHDGLDMNHDYENEDDELMEMTTNSWITPSVELVAVMYRPVIQFSDQVLNYYCGRHDHAITIPII